MLGVVCTLVQRACYAQRSVNIIRPWYSNALQPSRHGLLGEGNGLSLVGSLDFCIGLTLLFLCLTIPYPNPCPPRSIISATEKQRLKAAGAYSHATSDGTAVGGGEFCRENFLHVPTMERSLNLRHQLARLVKLRFGSEVAWKDCRTSGTLRPPSRRQTDALRQVPEVLFISKA